MLDAAAEGPPVANIIWRQGSSYDIGLELGPFRLVAMGRSFHWMDRADTLRRLDTMLVRGGAVTLFHDTHPDLPDNAWLPEWRALLGRYADRSHRDGLAWVRHEALLLGSAFSELEEIAVIERRHTPVAALVDRRLSLSSNSRSKLGDRAEESPARAGGVPGPHGDRWAVTEVVATSALIARRP